MVVEKKEKSIKLAEWILRNPKNFNNKIYINTWLNLLHNSEVWSKLSNPHQTLKKYSFTRQYQLLLELITHHNQFEVHARKTEVPLFYQRVLVILPHGAPSMTTLVSIHSAYPFYFSPRDYVPLDHSCKKKWILFKHVIAMLNEKYRKKLNINNRKHWMIFLILHSNSLKVTSVSIYFD
jgi:hypothetical protein